MRKTILLLAAAALLTLPFTAQSAPATDSTAAKKAAADTSLLAGVKPGHITTVTINDSTTIAYVRPKAYQFVTNIPKDWYEFSKRSVSKKGLVTIGALAATTALLVTIDRPAMDAVQQFGRWSGISGEQKFDHTLKFNVGSTKVNFLDLPQNLNSAFYFIGEGWPTIAFTTGVLVKGLITNDNRAILTASQIGEGYIAMGVTVQILKRLTGRQSPFRTTEGSGSWHLFPPHSHYQNDVSNHDAFPSGHLATAMASITIYAENYPEYKLIRPIGYTVMGVVGLAMMNNGVHWISDYPLAIAIGYTYGKIVTSRGKVIRRIQRMGPGADKGKLTFSPAIMENNAVGMSLKLML